MSPCEILSKAVDEENRKRTSELLADIERLGATSLVSELLDIHQSPVRNYYQRLDAKYASV